MDSLANASLHGYLYKQGVKGVKKNWKKRFFILVNGSLIYYSGLIFYSFHEFSFSFWTPFLKSLCVLFRCLFSPFFLNFLCQVIRHKMGRKKGKLKLTALQIFIQTSLFLV